MVHDNLVVVLKMAFPQDAPNPQGKEVTERPFLLFCYTACLFIVAHRETYRVRYVLFHAHKVTAFGNTFDKTDVFFLFILSYAIATGANGAACWGACCTVGAYIAETNQPGGWLVSGQKGAASAAYRPKEWLHYMRQTSTTGETKNADHARFDMSCVSNKSVYAGGLFAASSVY